MFNYSSSNIDKPHLVLCKIQLDKIIIIFKMWLCYLYENVHTIHLGLVICQNESHKLKVKLKLFSLKGYLCESWYSFSSHNMINEQSILCYSLQLSS